MRLKNLNPLERQTTLLLLFAALFSYTASYTAMLSYCFVCSLVGPALLLTLGRDPGFGGVVALAGRS